MRGPAQRPPAGAGVTDAVAPAPLHPAAPQGPILGGRHRRGRLPLLQGGRAAAGAQRRLHSSFIHRAGGQRDGAEPTPAPLPERVRREDPAGGAQVSARVRRAGPRPLLWESGDAGWGCPPPPPAGAGRDARAGGGAGWGRGCSAWGAVRSGGRTREGGDGQTMCGNARGGSPGCSCLLRVGRAGSAWANAQGGAESAGRSAPYGRACVRLGSGERNRELRPGDEDGLALLTCRGDTKLLSKYVNSAMETVI